MKEQRLTGWNKQKPAFTFAKSREFGSGLRKASLYADLGLADATDGQFHGEGLDQQVADTVSVDGKLQKVTEICQIQYKEAQVTQLKIYLH